MQTFEICRDCLLLATVKTRAGEHFCEECHKKLLEAIRQANPYKVIKY